MLHPVRVPPPTSRGPLPPWMFPRGIPSAALHTKQQVPVGGRSRASPIHGSLALALQRVPRPASGIVRRPPLTVSFLAADLSHLIITGVRHTMPPARQDSRLDA
jgi:hypothetical protein